MQIIELVHTCSTTHIIWIGLLLVSAHLYKMVTVLSIPVSHFVILQKADLENGSFRKTEQATKCCNLESLYCDRFSYRLFFINNYLQGRQNGATMWPWSHQYFNKKGGVSINFSALNLFLISRNCGRCRIWAIEIEQSKSSGQNLAVKMTSAGIKQLILSLLEDFQETPKQPDPLFTFPKRSSGNTNVVQRWSLHCWLNSLL